MYQKPIIAGARVNTRPRIEIPLRHYLASHSDALSNSAVVLAGQKGARLMNDIEMGLEQPGPITRRIAGRLLQLFDILALRNVQNLDTEEAERFNAIDPADPVVFEFSLLTDELRSALLSAGYDPDSEQGI